MSLAIEYAPTQVSRPRLLGRRGLATLAVVAAVMLEQPVRLIVRLAAAYWYDPGFGGAAWELLFLHAQENRVGRMQLWAHVGLALTVLLVFTLWNGRRQRGTRTSVAVFIAGAAIIVIGLFFPVPIRWFTSRGWAVMQ